MGRASNNIEAIPWKRLDMLFLTCKKMFVHFEVIIIVIITIDIWYEMRYAFSAVDITYV